MLNTEIVSEKYRKALIDHTNRRVLLTNFIGTEQEQDLTEPSNCLGYGRIRHFRRSLSDQWPENPLPIEPACKALNLPITNIMRAQVFQNAACNWRCWYCYVPFNLLTANKKHAGWLSAEEMINLYLKEDDRPLIIDLTGGQPDLTPEWVLWTMDELERQGLSDSIYLWSDDNLSNDFFWRFLTEEEQLRIATYPLYGRVCCFKGFNIESFVFNTKAEPEGFDYQFKLMKRLLGLGLDLYGYVTLTTPSEIGIADSVAHFIERLQELDENLPLRIIPLEIREFSPVTRRLNSLMRDSLDFQYIAIDAWQREIEMRFSSVKRSLKITDVPLHARMSKNAAFLQKYKNI